MSAGFSSSSCCSFTGSFSSSCDGGGNRAVSACRLRTAVSRCEHVARSAQRDMQRTAARSAVSRMRTQGRPSRDRGRVERCLPHLRLMVKVLSTPSCYWPIRAGMYFAA